MFGPSWEQRHQKPASEFHTIMIGGKKLSEAFFIISFHYFIISEKTANYFRELWTCHAINGQIQNEILYNKFKI